MFSDPVSFNGGTRVEVISVLANCGRDTDRARRALVTWIRHKQEKGRSTEHILIKLRDIESKFIRDISLHNAFRDARAETFLPRAPDLPLPTSVRRNSETRPPSSPASFTTSIPRSAGHASNSSPLLVDQARQISPSIPSLRLSQDSSYVSEILRTSSTSRRSLPQNIPHAPLVHTPRIQIPQALRPGPSSPITSSPEDSGLHQIYRYRSNSEAPSYQSHGLLTPPSTSPPEFPWSPSSNKNFDPSSHSFHGRVSPLPLSRAQIPRTRSRRNTPHSPPTSEESESDIRSRYRPISQQLGSISPGHRRVTPPRTTPPSLPLPPIPFDNQGGGLDSGTSKRKSLKRPPTPARSPALQSSSVMRPLPIQPIPSPVPGSDESGSTDMIGENLSQQRGDRSYGDLTLPSDVVREDSPLYEFNSDLTSPAAISPPPAYADHLDAYFQPDMPTIGDALDRAVSVCGGSSDVRLEVSRCIGFHRGYEPPYWQTRLQACGLHAEAARYLVDEMSKQVNWAASTARLT